MLLVTCKCLNIKLYIKGTEEALLDQNLSEDFIPTGFFPSGEVEVELDAKGIKQEHGYLVHRRKHGNYTVFRCLNCAVDSYALEDGGDRVIISKQLESDQSVIERQVILPEFSDVFRIILMNRDTQFPGTMPDPKSRSYESLQCHLNDIQKELSNFILQEESAMESRIRLYEETQKTAFTELQSKLKEEKKKMISLLLSSAQLEMGSETDDTGGRSDKGKRSTDPRKAPAKKKSVGRVKSMPPTLEHDNEDDELFPFDGFTENTDEPFYKDSSSDDDGDKLEDEDDEEASYKSRGRYSRPGPSMYSSSVPISVPMWNMDNNKNRGAHFPAEEENTPAEPDQIAASMQAMAQSITDDNRYIFGERPRPRLNTGDFR